MKQELKTKKFRSPLDSINVKSENCSSHLIDDYGFDISKYGEAKIIKKGQTDFYQIIQSYKDNADLKIVLTQVRQTRDMGLLNQRQSSFGDMTGFPTTYIEAANAVKNSKNNVLKNISDLTDIDYSQLSDKNLNDISQEVIAQQVYQKIMKQINSSTLEKGVSSNE